MDIKDLFNKLNFKKITKEEFSNILLNYYKNKIINFYDLRDDLNEYMNEDLHEVLSESEEELLNDKVWSIALEVGNEDDNEGFEDCYLYLTYEVKENETIAIIDVELI